MFYFISWGTLIITTFLLEKSKVRLYISILLYLLICTSQISLQIDFIYISIGFLLLFLLEFIFILKIKTNTFLLFCYIFCIAMLYCSIHFFVIYEPIYLKIPLNLFIALCISLFSYILFKNMSQIICIILGACILGEIFLKIILFQYEQKIYLGTIDFIVTIECCFVCLTIWFLISNLYRSMINSKQNYEKGWKEF